MTTRPVASFLTLILFAVFDAHAQTPPTLASARQPSTDPSALRVGVAKADGAYAVRRMSLEDYVAGVLAGEMAQNSAPAALEALAITIRTYAIANLRRHAAEGFDLCDLTHCQVLKHATPTTTRATGATAGRILLHDGVPASVFYSASCGGHTERPSAVWARAADPPFLPARADYADPHGSAWTADISAASLEEVLRGVGFRGEALRGLAIAARNASGRVVRLTLDGLLPREISGTDFRTAVGRALGWQHIRSTAFDVSRSGQGFRFRGAGSGHGVGLCVIGSARLAAGGRTAQAILAQYFPGTELSTLKASEAGTHLLLESHPKTASR